MRWVNNFHKNEWGTPEENVGWIIFRAWPILETKCQNILCCFEFGLPFVIIVTVWQLKNRQKRRTERGWGITYRKGPQLESNQESMYLESSYTNIRFCCFSLFNIIVNGICSILVLLNGHGFQLINRLNGRCSYWQCSILGFCPKLHRFIQVGQKLKHIHHSYPEGLWVLGRGLRWLCVCYLSVSLTVLVYNSHG